MNKDDATSPTAIMQSILMTAVIDAKERRDVMTNDILNEFVQTDLPKDKEKVLLKMTGSLVDMLIKLDSTYASYVITEDGKRVLYLKTLKALYGIIDASLLFYKKFKADLEKVGFKINPYDPCVANRTINGKQHTVVWHVDDLKSSHVNAKVNDDFYKWLEHMYGGDKTGHVSSTRGKIHEYLGMTLDYTKDGEVQIKMQSYIEDIVKTFPENTGKKVSSPASENLFQIREKTPKLSYKRKEIFHTTVAKCLFVTQRARPDIILAVVFLTTRVNDPDLDDWTKLKRLVLYLRDSKEEFLRLASDDKGVRWHVDAAFAVHVDFKSHTGGSMTVGRGAALVKSSKQKINSKSSTEAEIIAVDDVLPQLLWTRLFLQEQGYDFGESILYQDNKSAMLLEENGKASSSKRTRHLNIRFFYITDQIQQGIVKVEYCPTDLMTANYFTKPLQGAKFRKFRDQLMGHTT